MLIAFFLAEDLNWGGGGQLDHQMFFETWKPAHMSYRLSFEP